MRYRSRMFNQAPDKKCSNLPIRSTARAKMLQSIFFFYVNLFLLVNAMKIRRPWTTKQWCESVINPEWPFAYSKYRGQVEEIKGRVSSNRQDVRHECETQGVQSKCHICEDIRCNDERAATIENLSLNTNTSGSGTSNIGDDDNGGVDGQHSCHFQLQGVSWKNISKNIPTVSDIPWAVGGSHRYDFGGVNTTHICMYMSSNGPCQSNFGQDYSSCIVRCWGYTPGISGINNTVGPTTDSCIEDDDNRCHSSYTWPNSKLGMKYQGLNATPWILPQPTATWSYPKSNYTKKTFSFNIGLNTNILPQGFTFTLAGSSEGEEGFVDGYRSEARFRHPEGLAVDHDGYVYVADTGNHAIRMVSPSGRVSTIAGTGQQGFQDGNHESDDVSFSSPSGITVWRDWRQNGNVVLFVADTGNHRIRKITGKMIYYEEEGIKEKKLTNVEVECLSGYCGKSPQAGFSDGAKIDARFDSPIGITASSAGDIFITDTNNHLIRTVSSSGQVRTLAGKLVLAEMNREGGRLEGCPDPCLTGSLGHEDGYLSDATFSFPIGVALSPDEKSLLVTNRHFLRSIDMELQSVNTVAGDNRESERDGQGSEASFNKPSGITITSDGFAYVVDSTSCRIRRAAVPKLFVPTIKCSDRLGNVFRPSGCSSYNAMIDQHGLKATPQSGNINYNYLYRNWTDRELGEDFIGRVIKDCVGSPPIEKLDKKRWNEGTLVIDDGNVNLREDPNDGSLVRVSCLPGCNGVDFVHGIKTSTAPNSNTYLYRYSAESPICTAAAHAGFITNDSKENVLVDVIIHNPQDFQSTLYFQYSRATGEKILSSIPETREYYSITLSSADVVIQTISGAPAALRGRSCAYKDSVPPQEANFNLPSAISAYVNGTIDDKKRFLYVADRNNNVIRAISAVCSYPCENGGRCIGPDRCTCNPGWEGIDCSVPICLNSCPERQICVAPNTCSCIPGYIGEECTDATCVQKCEHGGYCSAPDTCSCASGWFDPNCTTPVCEQTCGNGGNCTSPNHCTCPTDWTGSDCRVPVCEQDCKNSGFCVAPNTCFCPPSWSGFDCGEPVCHQGFFEPHNKLANMVSKYWAEYRPCHIEKWCNQTNSFDCIQESRKMTAGIPLHGNEWRFRTGRKDKPGECFMIELQVQALSPFQYLQSWNNESTSYQRYSNITPHDWYSEVTQAWNAKISPEEGYAEPWTYEVDRQVALVGLQNVTQGTYKCANNGKCVAPDTCACDKGWMGFDCRVPICEQGYYEPHQSTFVKGRNDEQELEKFNIFLSRNHTYLLDPAGKGYSNPTYIGIQEKFLDNSHVERKKVILGGKSYLKLDGQIQGGYECSIRSVTEWEHYRSGNLFEHPNYFSRYMDLKVEADGNTYTHWDDMGWEPTYSKTEMLELSERTLGVHDDPESVFLYTDKGFMRVGYWKRTNSSWSKGYCILEFRRICEDDEKAKDLEVPRDQTRGFLVQDTDLSFRPRLDYDDNAASMIGQWVQKGGECIDQVIRGCFNNGTCVGPNECECSQGWGGNDCSIPLCEQHCRHNGNCTLPNICTCEKGWKGHDCSIPICAQNCNNGGQCIAPDTCKCLQWENDWRDGRFHGGVPLYQTPNGDPQMTGWTGYDCSTPICVQAETFILNVDIESYKWTDLIPLGGHGKDGKLECDKVQCPEYDEIITMNNGESFQTGCGYDPVDTGCCYEMSTEKNNNSLSSYECYQCDRNFIEISSEYVSCPSGKLLNYIFDSAGDVSDQFRERVSKKIKLCGPTHDPIPNNESNFTSSRFLCKRHQWEQGDYIDSAGLENEKGIGASNYGLGIGRHIRINYNNYIRDEHDPYLWTAGDVISGEGIFACYNRGSCIAPDVCTCRDGYTGFDCNTPMCRHQQVDGSVVGCLNGGLCVEKDNCQCVQKDSDLWLTYSHADRGITGWRGSDCSMPICVQGYYDPECEDNPFAVGGQGCFRCSNDGLCIAPDVCQCSEGWSGYDCNTPICQVTATSLMKKQLMTVDENKVAIFEKDPCEMKGFHEGNLNGHVARGVCALPNQCTCHCRSSYNGPLCQAFGGIYCMVPFQDRLYRFRNVLAPNQIFGTRSCYSGYEGAVDDKDKFISCHLDIYEPSYIVKNSISLLFWSTFLLLCGVIIFIYFRIKLHQKHVRAKIERRRMRRGAVIPSNFHAFYQDQDIDVGKKEE